MTHLHTKFEMSSFIRLKDMEGVPYVTGDVIKMLGVKTDITFGFLIPIFHIHYATVGKLS